MDFTSLNDSLKTQVHKGQKQQTHTAQAHGYTDMTLFYATPTRPIKNTHRKFKRFSMPPPSIKEEEDVENTTHGDSLDDDDDIPLALLAQRNKSNIPTCHLLLRNKSNPCLSNMLSPNLNSIPPSLYALSCSKFYQRPQSSYF